MSIRSTRLCKTSPSGEKSDYPHLGSVSRNTTKSALLVRLRWDWVVSSLTRRFTVLQWIWTSAHGPHPILVLPYVLTLL